MPGDFVTTTVPTATPTPKILGVKRDRTATSSSEDSEENEEDRTRGGGLRSEEEEEVNDCCAGGSRSSSKVVVVATTCSSKLHVTDTLLSAGGDVNRVDDDETEDDDEGDTTASSDVIVVEAEEDNKHSSHANEKQAGEDLSTVLTGLLAEEASDSNIPTTATDAYISTFFESGQLTQIANSGLVGKSLHDDLMTVTISPPLAPTAIEDGVDVAAGGHIDRDCNISVHDDAQLRTINVDDNHNNKSSCANETTTTHNAILVEARKRVSTKLEKFRKDHSIIVDDVGEERKDGATAFMRDMIVSGMQTANDVYMDQLMAVCGSRQ